MTQAELPTEQRVSAELLPTLFSCDFSTGELIWKERDPATFRKAATFNKQFAGRPALTALNKGYRCGRLFDRMVQAHRVVFALAHGRWPVGQVDHIDGNPANNRLDNLREVTNAENHRNERRPRNNTSGVAGVGLRGDRWRAHIKVNFRQIHLGVFSSKEEAIEARRRAEREYGFHKNHGRAA